MTGLLSIQIISVSLETQEQKRNYAEINNIKHGLFSIFEWKLQLTKIIEEEIGDFNLQDNKENLKPVIESQLRSLIANIDQRLKDKNKKTFGGRFKQTMINSFVDIKDIQEGVPQYAEELIKVLEKPKNERKIKAAFSEKVGEYFAQTFEENQNQNSINAIAKRVGASDIESAKVIINETIATRYHSLKMFSWSLIFISVLAFLVAAISKKNLPNSQYLSLVAILLFLLAAGVTTPMIDLEAKITEMKFMLLDHPIVFSNQVLYFQTKSVMDVFWLMIRHEDIQMKIVGLLMVTFSVLFPVVKLISSVAYYYNPRNLRDNKWIQFFVLKSGKWSMTDVMIIAIFMAYIGFNGVIESQFDELQGAASEGLLLTTNGTSLQPGFYLFMTYAVLAMFLSEYLVRRKEA